MSRSRADAAAMALWRRASAPATRRSLRCIGPSLSCRYLSTRCRSVIHQHQHRSCTSRLEQRRNYAVEAEGPQVAVLGGGLTGLTTAYYLAKKLPSTAKITLIEGSSRLGGWIRTEEHSVDFGEGRQGTVSFERGPRTISSLATTRWRYDDLVLYDLALDLGLTLHFPGEGVRRLYYPDHLVSLPPHQNLFDFCQEQLAWDSASGFARLTANLVMRKFRGGGTGIPDDDVSVAEWLRELTGGDAIGENIASAMLGGIYGGDIDKLSARSVLDFPFSFYHLPTIPSDCRLTSTLSAPLLKGLGKDRQIQGMAQVPKGRLVNFGPHGMETLTKALGHALKSQHNVEILLDEDIHGVSNHRDENRVGVTTSKSGGQPRLYDKVISTLPGQYLARMTGETLPTLATLQSVSIKSVNLYFPRLQIMNPGVGYLIPRSVSKEHNPERALGVFFDSSVLGRRPDEPEGMKLFVLMGGHYYDPVSGDASPPSDEVAIQQARALLERHMGIGRDEPCHAVAGLATDCIPQHHVGHEARMRKAHAELMDGFDGRLAVASGSFTHIGTAASMAAAYRVADAFASDGARETGLESFLSKEKHMLTPADLPLRPTRPVGS